MLRSREVSEKDRSQIEQWILADSDHKTRCTPDFWLKPEEGVKLFAIEDEQGPALFIRGEMVLRLHIQFPPDRARNARNLAEFIPLVEKSSRHLNYRQIIWDSVSDKLIQFAGRFGYRRSPNEIVKDLN